MWIKRLHFRKRGILCNYMKQIIIAILIFIGGVGVASAYSRIMQIDQTNLWAVADVEIPAQVYRVVDTEFNNVCYYWIYNANRTPDVECMNVASSSVKQ